MHSNSSTDATTAFLKNNQKIIKAAISNVFPDSQFAEQCVQEDGYLHFKFRSRRMLERGHAGYPLRIRSSSLADIETLLNRLMALVQFLTEYIDPGIALPNFMTFLGSEQRSYIALPEVGQVTLTTDIWNAEKEDFKPGDEITIDQVKFGDKIIAMREAQEAAAENAAALLPLSRAFDSLTGNSGPAMPPPLFSSATVSFPSLAAAATSAPNPAPVIASSPVLAIALTSAANPVVAATEAGAPGRGEKRSREEEESIADRVKIRRQASGVLMPGGRRFARPMDDEFEYGAPR